MSEAYIYEAIRTPRGKNKGGSLHGTKALDLVVGLIEEIITRFPDIDYNHIDDIILGIVTPVGDQGGNLARTAAIASTLPQDVPGFQINRFCASGLEATTLAAQKVKSGWERFVLAGGVECMSRTSMGFDGGPMYLDPVTNYDAYFIPQGISADLIATIEGFSREDVDSWALSSQQRAEKAWSSGFFTKSVVPVKDINGVTILDTDEHRRPDTTLAGLAKLNPAFVGIGEMGGFDAVALQKYYNYEKINHVHTGGNSSGIVDGAGLILIGSEKAGKEHNLVPRARVVASATVSEDPTIMLTAPTPATKKVLDLAGLTPKDIDVWEINEAFSAVVLKWIKDMKLDKEQVNVNGGAIALGHPLGATGAMLVGTVLDELERINGRYGLITLCIAGGMGAAMIIERL